MTKAELRKALLAFDWYYNYSDDGHVWREGYTRQKELEAELTRLECPFKWWEIHHALYGQTIENCIQVGDEHVVSSAITQDLADKILAWFND